MAHTLMADLRAEKIHRIDVNFNLPLKFLLYLSNWDRFIGRAAHILFLDSKPMIYMLSICFDYLFKWLMFIICNVSNDLMFIICNSNIDLLKS